MYNFLWSVAFVQGYYNCLGVRVCVSAHGIKLFVVVWILWCKCHMHIAYTLPLHFTGSVSFNKQISSKVEHEFLLLYNITFNNSFVLCPIESLLDILIVHSQSIYERDNFKFYHSLILPTAFCSSQTVCK